MIAIIIFRFFDNKGGGLCNCVSHDVTDAAGFSEILKLRAKITTVCGPGTLIVIEGALTRPFDALAADLQAVSSVPRESSCCKTRVSQRTIEPAKRVPVRHFKAFTVPVSRVDSFEESGSAHVSGTNNQPSNFHLS